MTTTVDLRVPAREAVAKVAAKPESADLTAGVRRMQAVGQLRSKAGRGASLRDLVEAVDWALDHPSAADLPEGSVVASTSTVWHKNHPNGGGLNWTSTTGGYWEDRWVDEALQAGATVLRVGTGD